MRAVGLRLVAIVLGDVEGDVGGERGLAHAGAAGEDDQVGGLQAAHDAVEVVEAGGEPGQVAVALIGGGRHVDGVREGVGEAREAAIVAPGLGELVERRSASSIWSARRHVDRRVDRRC